MVVLQVRGLHWARKCAIVQSSVMRPQPETVSGRCRIWAPRRREVISLPLPRPGPLQQPLAPEDAMSDAELLPVIFITALLLLAPFAFAGKGRGSVRPKMPPPRPDGAPYPARPPR